MPILTEADDIALLRYIHSHIRTWGFATSRRQIARNLGLRSTSPVHARMTRLIDMGWITSKKRTARGLNVTRTGITAMRKWDEKIDQSISEWRAQHSG